MSSSRNKRLRLRLQYIICGIFDKRQHNRQYMRLIWQYLPGKSFKQWNDNREIIKYGHLYILQAKRIKATQQDMDNAAYWGQFHIINYFMKYGVYCTSNGANAAAKHGRLDMICKIYDHGGVLCTSIGANKAAENGRLDILRKLQTYNIYCTSFGADMAAQNGHLHIVQYLRIYNIHCTWNGVDQAAIHGHLHILRDLHKHGLKCGFRVDLIAAHGHLNVLLELMKLYGVKCTPSGLDCAARNGHLHVIQEMRKYGIYCTQEGANKAAFGGHLHIVKYLYEQCSICCTELGADWAAYGGHLYVLKYLYEQCNIHYTNQKMMWQRTDNILCKNQDIITYLKQQHPEWANI